MASWVVYPSQTSQTPDFTDASNTVTRRHHSKSRMGCTVCKKRRIKCDETKPACKQCLDYGRQCRFLITGSQSAVLEPQRLDTHGREASNEELFEQLWGKLQSIAQLCSLAELSIQKAALRVLVSHFTGCKDEWLGAPAFQQILQQNGIRLGLQSDYLLHAILAVTASHLNYLDPTKTHLPLVFGFHNSLSLRLYRERLNDIKPEDTDALRACGLIHTIMAIRSTIMDTVTSCENLSGLGTLILGLKSIQSFPAFPGHCLIPSDNQPPNSQLEGLFLTCDFPGQWTTEMNQDGSKSLSHLAGVETHLHQLAGSAVFESTYREPLQYLVLVRQKKNCFSILVMLFSFSNHLETGYFEALENHAPAALLLLGYWLAIFTTIKQWWITEPTLALCRKIHEHLLVVLPATVQGRGALLEPLAQAAGQ